MILVWVAPSESSSSRTWLASRARSPESSRTAPSRPPVSSTPGPDRVHHVVGVDQQRGVLAERGDLRPEGLGLVAVQQGEGVRRGATGRYVVAPARLQVRRRLEPGDVGGPGRRHRRQLLGPPGTHLDAGSVAGHRRHPGGGRGDRRVVVVDAEQHRLQHHALGEGAVHDQQRRTRGSRPRPPDSPRCRRRSGSRPASRRSARRRHRCRAGTAATPRRTGTPAAPAGPGRPRRPRRSGDPAAAADRTARRRCAGSPCRPATPRAAWSARSGRSAGRWWGLARTPLAGETHRGEPRPVADAAGGGSVSSGEFATMAGMPETEGGQVTPAGSTAIAERPLEDSVAQTSPG